MAANKISSVVLDSCVLIDVIENGNPSSAHYAIVKPLLSEAETGKIIIVVSSLILAEVGVGSASQTKLIDEFLENDYFELHNADSSVAREARAIRTKYPLDTIDAVHIATAVFTNSHTFITRDGDGKKKTRKILPLDNRIECKDGAKLRVVTLAKYNEMKNLASHPLLASPADDEDPPKLKFIKGE